MKKLALLSLLFFALTANLFGQSSADQITMKKVFGGYQFYQNDQRLNMSKLVKAMEPNEQAFQQIKAAQGTYTFATIVSAGSGFMMGWPIGGALAGEDMDWTMFGIGAGLLVVSIPLAQKFNKQAKNAVDTFNSGLQTQSFLDRTEINLTATGNGIGLVMKF